VHVTAPLYVVQHLFDEAQILVDNVFEQTQVRSDTSAALVAPAQWQYLYNLGQEVRRTLKNVSYVSIIPFYIIYTLYIIEFIQQVCQFCLYSLKPIQ